MYKLRIPVEKINFQQWRETFHTLRDGDYFGYVIAKNDEYFLSDMRELDNGHLELSEELEGVFEEYQ